MKRTALILAALALLFGGMGQARAEFIITFAQVGPDVVARGVGSLNFEGLTFQGFDYNPPSVNASAGVVLLSPNPPFEADYYGNISGTTSFGPGGNFLATSGTGAAYDESGAGVDGATGQLFLPAGYHTGDSFTVSSTWDNTTISGLGLTPGTYSWTWGSGATADSLEVIIPGAASVPEPSTLTLLGIGAVCSLGYGRRRRRQSA